MYKKSKLRNGATVITAPMKSTQTITILVIIKTGSKNENEKNRGISHFLEHIFFKGTKKRPNTLDISKELDSVGGLFNAFTGKEQTGFYIKVDNNHCELALDVISDILLNSNFSAEEIEKEKGTIIEELNMYLDSPASHIPDLFENLIYNEQPLGYDEIGNKKTIMSVQRKDFVSYYKKHYFGENTVITVTGNFEEKNIRNKIKKYFKDLKIGKISKEKITTDRQSKPEILLQYKKTDQTHLSLGVRGYDINHKDRYILTVLSTILGGNMSSRLFISVRERNGLAYYIHSYLNSYKNVGYFTSQAGVNNGKCLDAIKIILNEYKKISEEIVSEEEIKRAKNYLRGKMMISLESSDSVASFIANQEINNGKILTPEEKFAKIDTVTAQDIQRVAQDIFTNNKLNLALIGPFKNKKIFEKILKF